MGNRIVEYDLQIIAHNGKPSDRYVVLNCLSNWHSISKIVKKGKGIIFLKTFNTITKETENNYFPHYNKFRCGMTHLISSFERDKKCF